MGDDIGTSMDFAFSVIWWILCRFINFFMGIFRMITTGNIQQMATSLVLFIILCIGAKFQNKIPMPVNTIIVIAPFWYICDIGGRK